VDIAQRALARSSRHLDRGIALFIIGRWLIKVALAITAEALDRQRFDPTLVRYIASALAVILNVMLVIAVLGFFGVETTTFAALSLESELRSALHGAGCWRILLLAFSWCYCAHLK